MSPTTSPSASASALRTRWQALAPREQRLLLAASTLIALALLWWLALAPALHTLRTAPARHASLDAQLHTVQALRAEAQQLQNATRTHPDTALRALQTSVTERFGTSARLSLSGDRATLTLQGTAADTLLPWLAQARSNARALPQEVHLVRASVAERTAATGAARPPATPTSTTTPLPGARSFSSANANGTASVRPTSAPDHQASAAVRWSGTLVLALPAH